MELFQWEGVAVVGFVFQEEFGTVFMEELPEWNITSRAKQQIKPVNHVRN